MPTNIAVTSSSPLLDYKSALDIAHEELQAGQVDGPLDELFEDLHDRREQSPENWTAYARACLGHPICRLLHQDPLTYRAFAKPRGYAGDGVMMDYIYGLGEAAQAARDATPLGRAIFRYMGTRPFANAVRFRRRVLADLIDAMVEGGGASVLAIAAGHLREIAISAVVQSGQLQEFVAYDQDEASLAVVAHDYADLGIRTIPGSVRQILEGKAELGQYDFVYAGGLFDCLNASAAAALARRMFEMTRPGGRMLIPNFLAGARDPGYLESFMCWHLIYRNHSDMEALAATLPPRAVTDYRIFDDSEDTMTFLLVSKAT